MLLFRFSLGLVSDDMDPLERLLEGTSRCFGDAACFKGEAFVSLGDLEPAFVDCECFFGVSANRACSM
jgi:hypothetical protein